MLLFVRLGSSHELLYPVVGRVHLNPQLPTQFSKPPSHYAVKYKLQLAGEEVRMAPVERSEVPRGIS